MIKLETQAIDWFKRRSNYLFFCIITLISILVRICFKDYVSDDATVFLLPWYDSIKELGVDSLSYQIGNYNLLYQFIIFLFTLLPIKALYAYKIFSVIFDYLLAIILALISVENEKKKLLDNLNSNRFVIVYSAVIMCPIVFFNSSCWAQCDSIYSFFIFASLYSYMKKRYTLMFILFGLSFAFKFQAVFVLPFILIVYFLEKKFSIAKLLYIPVMLLVTALPGIIMGRSILSPFRIYIFQTTMCEGVSFNYNSFWNCIINELVVAGENYYKSFSIVAICFTMCVLGAILFWAIKRNISLNYSNLIYLLHITVYTCILFLPSMHERYGYIYEMTAILLVFINKKTVFPALGLILLSCITYGWYLFNLQYSVLILSLINVIIYGWYIYNFITSNIKGLPRKEAAL